MRSGHLVTSEGKTAVAAPTPVGRTNGMCLMQYEVARGMELLASWAARAFLVGENTSERRCRGGGQVTQDSLTWRELCGILRQGKSPRVTDLAWAAKSLLPGPQVPNERGGAQRLVPLVHQERRQVTYKAYEVIASKFAIFMVCTMPMIPMHASSLGNTPWKVSMIRRGE